MPSIFARLKNKDGWSRSKKGANDLAATLPSLQKWEDAYARTSVEPEEVQELVRRCTEEIKARALDHPLLILSYRPTSNPSAVRTFVRHFFDPAHNMRGDTLVQELRMIEPMVIVGVIKWCWARIRGGVVGWEAYELFKVGEQDSRFARDSFRTFIPLSVDNGARSCIIFDFFDLLSAIAAHSKANGLGGLKLSRMAGWWSFEQRATMAGFEPAYANWLRTADATSHLFFAYLRTLAPDQARTGMSMLPTSLQKLLGETEYPPRRPTLLQTSTSRVVMIVDTVSPTPFALLRRANHFQYREDDLALHEFSGFDDPVDALTEECRRVLRAVSAANQSQASSSKHSTGLRDASWSRFEDIGFSSSLEEEPDEDDPMRSLNALRSAPASKVDLGRPTTPSWADFLSSGFNDDRAPKPSNALLPPDKVLPPLGETGPRQRSSQSHNPPALDPEHGLEPGELASITRLDLDDAFWWVWMSSLAPEEPASRKSAFGRCAVVEVTLHDGRWLVIEEIVAGAATEPQEGGYIAEKKSFFSWKRAKGLARRKSTSGKHVLDKSDPGEGNHNNNGANVTSTASIGPDQHARIQAAAAQLQARRTQEEQSAQSEQAGNRRRGRSDHELLREKTNSVLTLQPVILKEASSAMKWAKNYDKEAIREAYLADGNAGRGRELPPTPTADGGGGRPSNDDYPAYHHPAENEASQNHPSAPFAQQPVTPITTITSEQQQQHGPPFGTVVGPAYAAPPVESPRDTGRTTPLPPGAGFDRDGMTSPEPPHGAEEGRKQRKLRKEMKEPRGLRKLFSRARRSSRVPDNAAADVNDMLRQDATTPEPRPVTAASGSPPPPPPPPPPTEQSLPEPAVAAASPPAPESPPLPPPKPGQSYAQEAGPDDGRDEHPYEPSVDDDAYYADAADANAAHDGFSRFDQGPLADQPAFVPDDGEDDDALPPPITRHRAEPVETIPEVPESPQDRWAQIRRNAAERASARRTHDDHNGGYSQNTTEGEEETSGEDSIEARVARIKARVAELTTNMEESANGGPQPVNVVRQ